MEIDIKKRNKMRHIFFTTALVEGMPELFTESDVEGKQRSKLPVVCNILRVHLWFWLYV